MRVLSSNKKKSKVDPTENMSRMDILKYSLKKQEEERKFNKRVERR